MPNRFPTVEKKLLLIAVSVLIAGCTDAERPQQQKDTAESPVDSVEAGTPESTDTSRLNGLWKSRSSEFLVELKGMSGKKGRGVNYNYFENRSCYDRAVVEYQRLSTDEYRATYSGGVAGHPYTERVGLKANGDTLLVDSYEEGQQYVFDRISRPTASMRPMCNVSPD